jgi:hypothetical protein
MICASTSARGARTCQAVTSQKGNKRACARRGGISLAAAATLHDLGESVANGGIHEFTLCTARRSTLSTLSPSEFKSEADNLYSPSFPSTLRSSEVTGERSQHRGPGSGSRGWSLLGRGSSRKIPPDDRATSEDTLFHKVFSDVRPVFPYLAARTAGVCPLALCHCE